ncbi:MAG TPA: hemerythrin domain-containing protein [Polyangia bacterium]
MLVTVGKSRPQPPSMREMLTDCHARIRKFCALARRLAEGGPADQVRDAATQVHRYFSVALPLHIRDEDESVRPRLERLGEPSLSAALARMSAEHVEADRALVELLAQWSAIAAAPDEARCRGTAGAAARLDEHLARHLHDEETVIFPALDRLPRAEWDAIVAEMQARRR